MWKKLLAGTFFAVLLGLNSLANAALDTPTDVRTFRATTESRLKDWDDKIAVVQKRADASNQPQRSSLQASVRDLESHRQRIADELGRLADKNDEGKNTAAESNIDRHFQQMESLYSSNRADGAEGQGRL